MDIEKYKAHRGWSFASLTARPCNRGRSIFGKRPGARPERKKGVKSGEKIAETLTMVSEPLLRERLMTMAVREIAISLYHSREETKRQMASLLPEVKARRFWSELKFLNTLDVSYYVCATITDKVVGLLQGVGDETHHSYIRPRPRG